MEIEKIKPQDELIESVLLRGVSNAADMNPLLENFKLGENFRVKFSINKSNTQANLETILPLIKLGQLQSMGHQIILVFDDFDDVSSPQLEIYEKFLNLEQTELHFNSKWLEGITFDELCKIYSLFFIAGVIEEPRFKDRLSNGQRVPTKEIMYQVLRGFESSIVRSDLEIGNFDNLLNLQIGQVIQRHYNQEPQSIIVIDSF